MPEDVTPFDWLALAWFLALWSGYNLSSERLIGRRTSLNMHLQSLRRAWMLRMLQRDNRIVDSTLVGHTIHSISFFASTTMLILAGLLGVFGAVDSTHQVISQLALTVPTSKSFFELKLLFLVGIFTYGFFKFTWALRQYNYCCAIIGSAPLPPIPAERLQPLAEDAAEVLTLAITSFNGGLRSYYFALAALTWFIQPWLFMLATAGMLAVLLRRQRRSRTLDAISRYAGTLSS